jgi:hypothetical protein
MTNYVIETTNGAPTFWRSRGNNQIFIIEYVYPPNFKL